MFNSIKYSAVIITLAFLSLTIGSDLENFLLMCPEKNNTGIKLPNPKDCSSYFVCINDFPVVISCPEGLQFDEKSWTCTTAEIAKCRFLNETHSPTKEGSTLSPNLPLTDVTSTELPLSSESETLAPEPPVGPTENTPIQEQETIFPPLKGSKTPTSESDESSTPKIDVKVNTGTEEESPLTSDEKLKEPLDQGDQIVIEPPNNNPDKPEVPPECDYPKSSFDNPSLEEVKPLPPTNIGDTSIVEPATQSPSSGTEENNPSAPQENQPIYPFPAPEIDCRGSYTNCAATDDLPSRPQFPPHNDEKQNPPANELYPPSLPSDQQPKNPTSDQKEDLPNNTQGALTPPSTELLPPFPDQKEDSYKNPHDVVPPSTELLPPFPDQKPSEEWNSENPSYQPPQERTTEQPSYQPPQEPTTDSSYQPSPSIPDQKDDLHKNPLDEVPPSLPFEDWDSPKNPSYQPSYQPPKKPSYQPTKQPITQRPPYQPPQQPSYQPPQQPSQLPPTQRPPYQPPQQPSQLPPTQRPPYQPPQQPSYQPPQQPSYQPPQQPSYQPPQQPSYQPPQQPSYQPPQQPSYQPPQQPSYKPSYPNYPFDKRCPRHNFIQVYFVNPVDCTSFYQCNWGIPYLKQCPKGLHFNQALNVCDWPRNANCRLQTGY